MEPSNQTVFLCLVVFVIFLANWEYHLFNFAFDWLHLVAIELAIVGFSRKTASSSRSNPASSSSSSSSSPSSSSSSSASPSSSFAGEASPETQTVNVEVAEIDVSCPLRPTGGLPTHDVYGPLAKQLKEEFLQLIDGPGDWEPKFENPDVRISGSKSSESCFRFQFEMANTPLTCFDFLNSINKRQEWDDMVAEARVVEMIDQNTLVYYVRTKPIFPTAARDTVVFSYRTVLPDGRLLNVTKSVEHPSAPADASGKVIRAEVGLSGMVCAAADGNVKKTKVLQISNLDPKGWIPAQVKTMVLTKSLPKSIANVGQKVRATKPLDLKMVTVSKQVASGAKGPRVDFAPLLARIKEVESSLEKVSTAGKAGPHSPVEQVREALEFATPFMIGTIYFVVLYEYLVPRRK